MVAEGAAVADLGIRGVGIGWRPEIDLTIPHLGVDFVEVVAEHTQTKVPRTLGALHDGGHPVLPHGISLSLGGADRPDPKRLRHLAALADRFGSPVVSDHVCFVRADGIESGHLLPVAFTKDSLKVTAENTRIAQDHLPVPLAVENVAAILEWPEAEMTESEFLAELVDLTGVHLILDVANLYANARNFGRDPLAALDDLPLENVAYIHIAGGEEHDGIYHDTHAHPVAPEVLDLLSAALAAGAAPAVLLEYDRDYPSDAHLVAELRQIRARVDAAR